MRRLLPVLTLLLVIGSVAEAQQPLWRLGGRVLYVPSESTSEPVGDTGTRLELQSGAGLEFDATLLFAGQFAVEFTLGGIGHDVRAIGETAKCTGVDGGTVWLIPVTAVFQYHPPIFGPWDPYVGIGLAYIAPISNLTSEFEGLGFDELDLDGEAGFVAQAGVGYQLDDHWYLNIDFRYIQASIEARVRSGDTDYPPVELDMNPLLAGFGVGFRF
ncbi:MAG: OmpW family outer membrane protein [Holophagae bacterium]|jgi:outer membrane protein